MNAHMKSPLSFFLLGILVASIGWGAANLINGSSKLPVSDGAETIDSSDSAYSDQQIEALSQDIREGVQGEEKSNESLNASKETDNTSKLKTDVIGTGPAYSNQQTGALPEDLRAKVQNGETNSESQNGLKEVDNVLKLAATFISTDPGSSYAIIEIHNKQTRIVNINQDITQTGIKLQAIESNHVLLNNNGKIEQLEIQDRELLAGDERLTPEAVLEQLNLDSSELSMIKKVASHMGGARLAELINRITNKSTSE